MDRHLATLVMGARSGIGRLVLQQLIARGVSVRGSSRRVREADLLDGVPMVAADLTDPDSVAAAFEGIDQAFVFAVPEGAPAVLAAARAANLRRIVLLSSGSVLLPSSSENPITADHRLVEQALTGADGPVLVPIRPLVLATNCLGWAHQITATGTISLYQPDALNAPVHEADVAAVAVAALIRPVAEDGNDLLSQLLTGPAQLSQREQVAQIGRVIGRELTVVDEHRDEALDRMSRFMPSTEADAILSFLDDCAAGHSPATDVARQVLGREPLTFASWAADHADDFR